MPIIKSAKKRVIQSEKRRMRNIHRKSAIKTAIRKVMDALESKDTDIAKEALRSVEAQLARAKGKGVLHPNTAARKISRLAKKVAQATRS